MRGRLAELLEACLANAPREPRKVRGARRKFRVIQGGVND